MPEYETFECNACDEEFAVYPDANAPREGYCSPACASEGKGLA